MMVFALVQEHMMIDSMHRSGFELTNPEMPGQLIAEPGQKLSIGPEHLSFIGAIAHIYPVSGDQQGMFNFGDCRKFLIDLAHSFLLLATICCAGRELCADVPSCHSRLVCIFSHESRLFYVTVLQINQNIKRFFIL
jgi:hypothetical protein